jgi:hypothetical protein
VVVALDVVVKSVVKPGVRVTGNGGYGMVDTNEADRTVVEPNDLRRNGQVLCAAARERTGSNRLVR